MSPISPRAPVLIFTYGNPSRGDDAIGPALYERLTACKQNSNLLDSVDLLTDFQLQVEHSLDMEHRKTVIFIDASMSASEPFEYKPIVPERDASYTTHSMSPASLLAVYDDVIESPAPACSLLTIRGYEFGLGQTISKRASQNIEKALEFITDLQF